MLNLETQMRREGYQGGHLMVLFGDCNDRWYDPAPAVHRASQTTTATKKEEKRNEEYVEMVFSCHFGGHARPVRL